MQEKTSATLRTVTTAWTAIVKPAMATLCQVMAMMVAREARVPSSVVTHGYVPDATADRRFESDNTVDRVGVDGLLSELDEYAVEEALQVAEAHGGELTVVSMGPERAAETVRKALSMGADAGIHIVDDSLHGSDAIATSAVLAAALEGRGFDLIVFGSESTDARMSVIPAMVAELRLSKEEIA